jgi:Cadherin domain
MRRYTIVSGDKTADFSIGENSGVLRVNRQLDFERKNAYQLTIQVRTAMKSLRNNKKVTDIQLYNCKGLEIQYLTSKTAFYEAILR